MKLYLLTSGKIERDFSGEFPNVYQATAFTNLKKAKKAFTAEKRQTEAGHFVELEYTTLDTLATEILKEELKEATDKQNALISAFADNWYYYSISYYKGV